MIANMQYDSQDKSQAT